jgi:MFS family permease
MAIVTSIKRKAHYGWAIFGLSFTNLTVEGGIKNSEAVFFVVLRDSFQSSAAATSALFSASGLVGAIAGPFLGRFLDRAGARVMFPLAGLLILVGWLASSLATDLWQLFILYSVVAAIGQISISSFSNTAVLAPWFPQTRGRALGLADAGNPTGQLIFTPLATVLVAGIGWRAAYQVYGIVFFLLVAPANFLFQKRPPAESRRVELEDGGASEAAVHSNSALSTDKTLSQPLAVGDILRQRALWMLIATRGLGGIGIQITRLHLVAFLLLAGYNPLQAGGAIGIAGLLNIIGRPILGALSDAVGREISYTITMSLAIASILLLLLYSGADHMWPLIVFIVLAGLSEGVNGLVIGAKATDIFPANSLGTVMGLVEVGRGVGIAVGPVLGGLLFDLRGDYNLAFSLSMALTFVSICSMWLIGSGSVERV